MQKIRHGIKAWVMGILLAASAAVAADLDGEWPGWRGPNRDGKSTEKGLLAQWPEAGPQLLWKVNGLGIWAQRLSAALQCGLHTPRQVGIAPAHAIRIATGTAYANHAGRVNRSRTCVGRHRPFTKRGGIFAAFRRTRRSGATCGRRGVLAKEQQRNLLHSLEPIQFLPLLRTV